MLILILETCQMEILFSFLNFAYCCKSISKYFISIKIQLSFLIFKNICDVTFHYDLDLEMVILREIQQQISEFNVFQSVLAHDPSSFIYKYVRFKGNGHWGFQGNRKSYK